MSSIRTILCGLADRTSTHERAQAVGATMEIREELERLRTLALDVDATLRALRGPSVRGARVSAKTIYQQLERARARSHGKG